MKKTIKIMLTLAFVIAALCVTASAAGTNGFYDIGTAENVAITAYAGTSTTAIEAKQANVDAADDATETYYEGSDRLGVTYSAATANEDYGIILVEGSSLPTASSAIYYINQEEAASTSVDFNVYPATITAPESGKTRNFTMYISSSVEGAELVSVPVSFVVGYEAVTIKYGDVDGNKMVNVLDLTRLKQYFAKWEVTINEANSNVNGDKMLNVLDLTRLKQYFAKWEVTLGPAA